MLSIAAHANVLSLFSYGHAVVPDEWRHDRRDGSLMYRFAGSSNTFTWGADAVADLAEKMDNDARHCKEAEHLLKRWNAVVALIDSGGLSMPDCVEVDHAKDEMRLVWEEQKLVVVIGDEQDASVDETTLVS